MAIFFPDDDPYAPYPIPINTKLRKENDFVIKELKLIAFNGREYDISPIRVDMNIYEDIFNNSVSGDLSLLDANDLFQLMPLIGEEKIRVSFTRPDVTANKEDDELLPEYKMEFRVYYISNRQLKGEKAQYYVLHFVSPDFIKNMKMKLSKTFKALPYSEMAKIAFESLGSDKPLVVEDTQFLQDYTCPNIYPFEFINSIAAKSMSASGNGSAYLFFCDNEQYRFCSIGQLFQQPAAATYTYQLGNILENKGNENTFYRDRTIAMDLMALQTYGFSNTFNILKNLSRGMYASRLMTYDIVRQVWEKIDFDYKEEFDQFKHLDKYDIHTDGLDALGSPVSFMKFLPTNKDHDTIPWIAGKEPGINPTHIEECTQHRYSQFRQIDNAKIIVSVSGDPRRKCGQIIEFLLPQAMGNLSPEHPEELDKYLRGKYLMTSVAHRLRQGAYWIEAEIVKDTFYSTIEHIDPVGPFGDTY